MSTASLSTASLSTASLSTASLSTASLSTERLSLEKDIRNQRRGDRQAQNKPEFKDPPFPFIVKPFPIGRMGVLESD
jgi:hypothetical protein